MTTEPTWRRDIGPFTDAAQARAQYDAQMHGIPGGSSSGALLVIAEACLLSGLELTDYERHKLRSMHPQTAAIIAGLIIRAHLTGKGEDPQ